MSRYDLLMNSGIHSINQWHISDWKLWTWNVDYDFSNFSAWTLWRWLASELASFSSAERGTQEKTEGERAARDWGSDANCCFKGRIAYRVVWVSWLALLRIKIKVKFCLWFTVCGVSSVSFQSKGKRRKTFPSDITETHSKFTLTPCEFMDFKLSLLILI